MTRKRRGSGTLRGEATRDRREPTSEIESNETFGFIAGFTSNGVPFGLTWDELREAEAEAERWIIAQKERVRTMRTVNADMNDLEMAFENRDHYFSYVLDLETGRVLMVPGYAYDGDVPEEMAEDQNLIDSAPAGRFLPLEADGDLRPSIDEAHEFVEGVEDTQLRARLSGALGQRQRPFRRFLDLVMDEAGEADRWHHFSRQCLRRNIASYLKSEGVTVACEPLPAFAPRFRTREQLLEGAKAFVARASRITGITRIAMIGSLTTDKREPNDVDLLVTVTAGAPMDQIAAAGRKLKGHCTQINRGADVFLASDDGRYLGRTCPWRECAPGLRVACEAQHCGTHVYDDFHRLQLPAELIASPPLELWPAVVIRGEVADDVRRVVGGSAGE